ncbi:hypothetical protein HPO96_14110 [Kribbella sandramycini]|uniref:Patatin-like phospholipase n=1 Tax=Kribbella sandramycini TaxID=60450 RepID=A0A7Y4KZ60_9ACTN|nr:hypothetical protein [Kribbella sandramycini]MBB6565107.1 hypothetical protein [Kribbella sandramycini]NOL41377.1 hypothetical protein [Kribbella sandramycini]
MLGESEGTKGDATIEQIGRRRTFTRTLQLAIVLAVVQAPMRSAVQSATAVCEVPARLSLLVDGLFIMAYVYAAYRAYKYVKFLDRQSWQRIAAIGAWLVCVAAVLDVIEDIRLWPEFANSCADLSTGAFTWVMRGIGVLGAIVLAVCYFATSRYGQRKLYGVRLDPPATFTQDGDAGVDAGRLVITCSGGGIRSASFCLGALQHLREQGLYDKASTVIGVSGGGYMAAAFHVLRRACPDPFAQGSPELARLRRQTRYLLQGGPAIFRAGLSVLFGLVVNLLLIGIMLRAIAWVLGWYLADQGVVVRGFTDVQVSLRPGGSWTYLITATALLAISAATFVLEKVWDRWARMPDVVRRILSSLGSASLLYGVPVAVLLLGVPGGLYLLGKLPGDTGLPSELLALVDPTKQGVASFSALVVVLIGLGRAVWNGLSAEGKESNKLRDRLLAFAQTKLAPWAGTAIIVLASVVVLLRWTGGYAIGENLRPDDWSVAVVLAAIAAGIKLFTDANRTSLHSFYRERLSRAFLVTRKPNGAAASLDYYKRLRYSEWAKPDGGGPQLVIAGVANVEDADFVPTQRDCVPFVFDAERIGIVGDRSLPDGGRRQTGDYEREADMLLREVTVPAAMAISGAALSPLTGRVNGRTRPIRLLLAVLNARLGVWLPNPYWNNRAEPAFPEVRGVVPAIRRYVGSVIDKPGPYRLLREAIGSPSMYDRRIYVTDGGHYDNLGLVEALRRKPAQVIVIDASNDAEDRFNALAEAIATARMDHGIEVDIDPSSMRRGSKPRADRAWTYGIATHPQAAGEPKPYKTEIFLVKALLAGQLGWDLEQYALGHSDFPRRTTSDQFYDEWDFEAYRELGYTLAESLTSHHRVRDRLADL